MIEFGVEPIMIWKFGNNWVAKVCRIDDTQVIAKTRGAVLRELKKSYYNYNKSHEIEIRNHAPINKINEDKSDR